MGAEPARKELQLRTSRLSLVTSPFSLVIGGDGSMVGSIAGAEDCTGDTKVGELEIKTGADSGGALGAATGTCTCGAFSALGAATGFRTDGAEELLTLGMALSSALGNEVVMKSVGVLVKASRSSMDGAIEAEIGTLTGLLSALGMATLSALGNAAGAGAGINVVNGTGAFSSLVVPPISEQK